MTASRICRFVLSLSTAIALFGAAAVQAQVGDYPSKTIRIVVPYPAGGGADQVARVVGQQLSERLKQTVVVENIGGASNTIGMNVVARSAPDGHTLGLATPIFVMTPKLMKNHPYDPKKDFTPVALLGSTPLLLVVHPNVPARSVKELVQLAKAKPGSLNFGSLGPASTQGLAAQLFATMAGIEVALIPYKGSAPATNDLLSGQIHAMFNAMPSMLAHVSGGKLRALGVSTGKSHRLMPKVPPVGDAVAGYEVATWYGFVAPAGTPKAIVERLNREVAAILKMPEIIEKMSSAGLDPGALNVEAFGTLLDAETAKWSKVIHDAKIQPE